MRWINGRVALMGGLSEIQSKTVVSVELRLSLSGVTCKSKAEAV